MTSEKQPGTLFGVKNTSLPTLYLGILLTLYLVFIAYASFYLTSWVSFSHAFRSGGDNLFFLSGRFRLHFWNLRDISTNILLYMPLGFLMAMYLASKGKLTVLGFSLFWGVVVSMIVETIQSFVGRVSDATDVMSNGTGYLLGFFIAYFSVHRCGLSPAAMLGLNTGNFDDRLNTLVGLRFVYMAIVLFVALLPLDLNVSVSSIYKKLQATGGNLPRLIVDPFFHFRHGFGHIQYLILKFLMFAPLAYLSSFILLLRKQPGLLLPASHCLVFGMVIELSKLFVSSGRSDIIVPVLAFLSGLVVTGLVYHFNYRLSRPTEIVSHQDRRYLLVSMLLIYCLFLLGFALSPFEFEFSQQAIRDKWTNDINWFPFRSHFSNRSIESAVDIVREFMLYVPLGVLLTLLLRNLWPEIPAKLVFALACLAGFCFAAWIEVLQILVIVRHPDFTDVLMAALGGLGGAVMAPLFKSQ